MQTRFRNILKEFKFENATILLVQAVDAMPNLFNKKSDVRYHIEVLNEKGEPTRQGIFNFTRKAEATKAFNKVKRTGSTE